MDLSKASILLPCHSLEDFPTHHVGDEAAGLLAAWSALWHPALVSATGGAPGWHRADDPPDSGAGQLFVVPAVSQPLLPAGWCERVAAEGAAVIRGVPDRAVIVAQALDGIGFDSAGVDDNLCADFLAMGWVYLQVELLTRQMRYMSSIDELHLEQQALAAARAVIEGDHEGARRHLRDCFEAMLEARERFYPVDCYLIDLTLVADTTLGQALRCELDSDTPLNLLMTGHTLSQLAQRESATLSAVRTAWEQRRIAVVGGLHVEQELPLVPIETTMAQLTRGRAEYQRHLGRYPTVFGRRRAGLTPLLPQLLHRSDYRGALHLTLDDGIFPKAGQSHFRWEGIDGSSIAAFGRLPLDARQPETFLQLAEKMAHAMDLDHVAAVMFAHWPGGASAWYDDLRRAQAYAPVLGKFVTLEEFFDDTDAAGRLHRFQPDEYRTPYLKQDVAAGRRDPISRHARTERRRAMVAAAEAVGLLACAVGRGVNDEATRVAAAVDATGDADDEMLDARIAAAIRHAAARTAARLASGGTAVGRATLVINPLSATRIVGVEPPGPMGQSADQPHRLAAQQHDGGHLVAVEVPAMGFAWIGLGDGRPQPPPKRSRRREVPMAEEHVVRNEFFEVRVDPHTGGIRALNDYRTRGNRLSQQLALRSPAEPHRPGDVWRDPDERAGYSVMSCDSVEITSAGPALGQLICRGRLLDREGGSLARYTQQLTALRGSRVLRLAIELDVDEPPGDDPWESYYAARFAWADSEARLWRSIAATSQATKVRRLEAPQFVEIRDDAGRIAILSGGHPYHRRVGERMLDTLLVVRGETAQRFELGIGVDLPNAALSAAELVSPPVTVPVDAAPETGPTGWLFHVDAANVIATSWRPLLADGRAIGCGVRLLETVGRPGRVRLRLPRPAVSARQVDFLGRTLVELRADGDAVMIDLAGYEWADVEATWQA